MKAPTVAEPAPAAESTSHDDKVQIAASVLPESTVTYATLLNAENEAAHGTIDQPSAVAVDAVSQLALISRYCRCTYRSADGHRE